jgi:FkbM family methyltransferase
MSKKVKVGLKKMFRSCGLEVRRARPFDKYEWLRGEDIKTVIDVGANRGQFAEYIHKLLPDARIYSFEPLKDCYDQLCKNMKGIPNFRAFQFALGDENKQRKMYCNDFSPSSSLLPMEELHKEAFPQTEHTTPEKIDIRRLDDISQELDIVENVLIKIDVQGFEEKVILGGDKVISRASVLIVETSFQSLYQGQYLFDAIYDMLRERGFRYMGGEEALKNPQDGSILACDSVFCRGKL